MKQSRFRFALVLAATLVAAAVPALAQAEGEMADMGMTPEMMAAWEKVASPNEHHAHLAKLAGHWKVTSKMWFQPGAPPVESEGRSTNEMIMGGRFLQSHFEGQLMGQPFHGMAIEGYDNALDKHVGSWIDSAGTMMMSFLGNCSEGGKVLDTVAEFLDPMTGTQTQMKSKTTLVDPNTYTYESWSKGPDGEFFKSMEITYTRM